MQQGDAAKLQPRKRTFKKESKESQERGPASVRKGKAAGGTGTGRTVI